MAEHVGEVKCLECGGTAGVYADKRSWLYTNCHRKHGGDDCGISKFQSAKGQARIRARWARENPEQAAVFLGEPTPEPVAEPEPEPQKQAAEAPVHTPKKAPKKGGFFKSQRNRKVATA